ncbi:prolipoprotein diacylglyceryl transferase [Inconstantimicrobium mannanitabidum]|uniref:Diacylglyceryl transferase n=1 Tax=Inconstantimicrobium mannanitabidum TaxID=1604901 RepID=A0ACB5RHW9_9CLOT|nr:prolipoprotein diacylglyceryl transferase [Clostridium sp. TW13]GKX68687.1 diacylglyceryl transferase [Clostridium sp. TW13]
MRPILFSIGNLHLYSYGLMIAIGIIAAYLILDRNARKFNYNDDHIFNMTIITVIMGILGGKVFYLLTISKTLIKDPSIAYKDLGSGFVVYGAIIFGALSVYIYCRRKKWDVLAVLDLVAPGVVLAQGFGRIGCFLAGCCYGAETKSKLSVVFPEQSLAPAGVHLYPTQIYSAIFDIALAIFLLWYLNRKKINGVIFSLYLIIYSIGRFIIEFFRADDRGTVGALSTSQFIAIFTLILGIIVLVVQILKGSRIKREEEK